MVRSVAVDPDRPERTYVAGPAGVFRSDDAGLTWEESDAALDGEPVALALDPFNPQTVFVVMTDGSLWKSVDGAAKWQLVWPAGGPAE